MFTEDDAAQLRTAYFMAGGNIDRGVHVMELITELRLITGKSLSDVLRFIANGIDVNVVNTIGATIIIGDNTFDSL